MFRRITILTLFAILNWTAFAQSNDSTAPKLDTSEQELVSISKEMYAAFDEYYTRAEKLKDDAEQEKFSKENEPSAKFVEQLIEFERVHHKTHAGLMAARRLVLLGAGGGDQNNPRDVGRRHALTVLRDYANAPELPEIIRYLDAGNNEPESETILRQLINGSDVCPQNSTFAKFMLARWALAMRDGRDYGERRLKELEEGKPTRYPKEKYYLLERLASALPSEKIAKLENEAMEILESLYASTSEIRQPGVIGVDENWNVIRFDAEKSKSMPSVKDLAGGSLFKERHLRVGMTAPELKLHLVSNKEWSLGKQLGKTVIIQFSFKGCGPCEAMYPDLQSLLAEYGEKLVVLGIMADEKREDTTDAVDSGKLTWNVYWDGSRGPVATQWSVKGFPTVYVVGPDGRMAAKDLRDERLKAKIAELMR